MTPSIGTPAGMTRGIIPTTTRGTTDMDGTATGADTTAGASATHGTVTPYTDRYGAEDVLSIMVADHQCRQGGTTLMADTTAVAGLQRTKRRTG